jgi:hypothetical protein
MEGAGPTSAECIDPVEAETIMKIITGRVIDEARFTGRALELDLGNGLRLRVTPEYDYTEPLLWLQLK